jgi:hypothetical protein
MISDTMRKFTLLFALVVSLTLQGWGQCTPSPIWTLAGLPGLWPNATIGIDSLPDGVKGVLYNPSFGSTLTAISPGDTTITPSDYGLPVPGTITVAINFMELAVSGLPPGMTSVCDNVDCKWLGDSVGCVKFSGTPTASGDYTITCGLTFNVEIPLVGPFTLPIALPLDYRIHIDPNVGIADLNSSRFSVDQNAPNPFSNSATIRFNALHSGNVSFELFDLAGNCLQNENISATAGTNQFTIDGSKLASGVYFYHLSDGENVVTRKMTVVK